MLVFLSCRTVEVKQTEEISKDEVILEPIVEKTLDEKINLLIDNYVNEPNILIKKIMEILPADNIDYNYLLSTLYLAIGEFQIAKDLIFSIPEYEKNVNYLRVVVISLISLNENYDNILDKIFKIDEFNSFATAIKVQDLLNNNKLIDAEVKLKKYYRQDKTNDKISLLYGDLYLLKVVDLNLGSKKVLNNSEERVIKSYYEIALSFYTSVEGSQNSIYYSKLSSIYKKLGQTLKAIKALDKAIELDPNDKWNYFDRGKLFFYLASYDKSLDDFVKAYEIDNDDFFTNVFLGRVYFLTNNTSKALFHYNKVMDINPKYYPAYKELSVLSYISGNKEKALSYIISLYNTKSDKDSLLSLYYVVTLLENGKVQEAKKMLQNLVKYEKNGTMKGIYNYFLDPGHTGDKVLNDALNIDDQYQRIRLTYYISFALERENVFTLSETLLKEVADSNMGYESKLAKYKLGEFNE